MTYPATTYAEGVELTITSGNQLHEIINGDATEEINTESGMVPSVRKALADSMLFKPAIAWAEGSVESDPFQTRLYGEGIYWAPAASNETPISMGANPNIDGNWFLAPVTGGESISRNTNLLSNHNFITQSPDDITHPSVTPTDYVGGTQIFSGVFVGDDIVGLTYIDGRVSWTSGTLYFSVPNSGALEYVDQTDFVASVADFDGKPRTRGVSYALVGDEYRVTVGVDALEDESANETLLGSVKFEQGSVATRHEVKSLFDIYGHPNMGIYDVRAFGAVNSIDIDSTDKIRAACNAINSAGGGTLSGGRGDSYLISGTSVFTTSDVTIDLNGAEIVFDNDLIYDGIGKDGGNGTSYGGVFWFNSGNDSTSATDNVPDAPANVLKNLRIRNLKLRQTGDALINVQACRGFRFRSCEDVEIENCTFDNLAGEDINGWFYEKDFRIHDNYFVDSRVLSISMMLQDSECYDNHFTRCDTPFELTATDVRVYGNAARGVTTGNFIKISDSSRGYKQDIEIFNNKLKGSFNSFFANEIIISGDRYNRVHSYDNEINCDITSGRVYNLLTADGSWVFSDTISDKGIDNALGDCVFMRPATPESTLNGNYTICGMKKIVGWSGSGLSLLQDNMNQQKVAKISYFNNTYIIKDGVTDHPSQGEVSGSMASTLYRGSLFVDPTIVLNYVISNNIFDNGSESLIDRSPDVTALIGSETMFIYRGDTAKTMTRFYGKKGGVIEIAVPLDAPQELIIQDNANIVNTLGVDLTISRGTSVKYCFSDTGSKMFQMS